MFLVFLCKVTVVLKKLFLLKLTHCLLVSHEKASNLYQPFVCLDALALLFSWLLSAEIQFVHAFIGSMSYFNQGDTKGTNSSKM